MYSLVVLFQDESLHALPRLLSCCSSISEHVDLLLLSGAAVNQTELLLPSGIHHYLLLRGGASDDDWDLRRYAAGLRELLHTERYDLILSDSSPNSVVLFSLLTGEMGTCMNEVMRLEREGDHLICEKYLYSMNIRGRFLLEGRPILVNISDVAAADAGSLGELMPARTPDDVLFLPETPPSSYHSAPVHFPEEKSLAKAERVILVGRGIGGKSNCAKATALADRLGWELGSSRPPVQEALVPADRLVGASGVLLHAEKCLVLGASGMAAFSVGIEGCREVLSVNTDRDVSIFSVSDLGLEVDCGELLDALLEQIGGE